MAKEAKKDPQELTVEQKLKALFQLQTMLSKIDEIKTLALHAQLPPSCGWFFLSSSRLFHHMPARPSAPMTA